MRVWLGLVGLVVACSSSGSDSGPATAPASTATSSCTATANCCLPTITVQVTDSSTGGPVGTIVTIDGDASVCTQTDTASVCPDVESMFYKKGTYPLTVSAGGYKPTTAQVEIPFDPTCCQCPAGIVVNVTLDPSR